MAKSFIGIDVGAGHLKLAVCDGSGITQVATAELPDNLVKDSHITSLETMSDVARDALRNNKITARDCAFVLNSNDVFTRRITMPAMTIDELKLNLPFEFRDYIADSKDKYRFDYALMGMKNDEEGNPSEMDILAAAAPEEAISSYIDMFRRAGLRLKAAAPDIMAYANIINRYNERTASVTADDAPARDFCILDIGDARTRVYLFPQGKYEVTRSIEFGVSSLINAVAEHFSVEATMAKTYLSSNYEQAQTTQTCLDLYERLGVEVARIISFFNFNYPESHLEAVHYCGAGSVLAPLVDSLCEHLSIEVMDLGAIMPPSSVSPEDLRLCPAAVGIALQ